jgi:phosphoglycerate dehydrogenase-like enzyme
MGEFEAPHVVLLIDDDGAAIADVLRERVPDVRLHVRPLVALTQSDLDEADACIGFRSRGDLDWRGLRWVHCSGAGHDAFTQSIELAPGALVSRTIGGMPQRMAEYVTARLLAFTQRLPELLRQQQAREWNRLKPRALAGTHALILGVGPMGQRVAETLSQLEVHCTGLGTHARAVEGFDTVVTGEGLDEHLEAVDWVVGVLPLTPATRGLLGAPLFARLRGACVVNIGRGATLDETALLVALETGHVAGAALDVFEQEPLPADSPLWGHPQVLVSPHVAAPTLAHEVADAFLAVWHAREAGTPHPLVVR